VRIYQLAKFTMFNNFSMTGTGLIVVIVTALLSHFGIVPADGQVLTLINDGLTLAGWALTIWGQLSRADLSWGFWRKAPAQQGL
jgi:hypothetical protein